MLQNRQVYALCTSRIQNAEVRESVTAFTEEAHRRGIGVILFNASLDAPWIGNDTACFSVFDLIPFQIVDMVVVMNEVIDKQLVTDTIIVQAKNHRVPVICYDGCLESVHSVFTYAGSVFASMLDHIFGKHGCRRVDLLTGLRGNYGAESMVMEYREALRRHGLPFEEERVAYGDYWEEPAIAAAERFLLSDTPDAIVCANDEMALAVCGVLRRHGLHVPDDVIVTGCDGILKERDHTPRLTTCVKNYAKLTAALFDSAELIIQGEDVPLSIEIPADLRISESCGCYVTEQRDQNAALQRLSKQLQVLQAQESEEHSIIGQMLRRKAPNVIDYLDVLAGFMPNDAYFCLRDCLSAELADSELRGFGDSGELMNTVTRKRREKQFAILSRAQLIPDLEKVFDAGRTLLINAVYLQNEIYGYYAYCGSAQDEEAFKLPKFIHTAGNVIGCTLAASRLKVMNERLVAARIRDSLTGMLNLHGALKMLSERLRMRKREYDHLNMVVIGLNRLRQINSVFGRAEGDQALLSLASAISDSIDSEAIAARVGGDEFLIAFFSAGPRISTAEALISVLKKRLSSYNHVSGKSYTIDISIGQSIAKIGSSLSVEAQLNDTIARKDAERLRREESVSKPSLSDADYSQISRILRDNLLSYCFQPIVSAKNGQIYAYEALMRTKGGFNISPLTILNYASAAGQLYEIEWLTYNNVLRMIRENAAAFAGKRVFINSIPGHFLTDTDFEKLLDLYSDLFPQLVVEFTEQAETEGEELQRIQARCAAYKMDIAVDDYGTGYSNISNLLKYSPNYVKIDRSLIANIHDDPKKQHFVTNIIEFAHANGFMALAEGVETPEELRAVIRFGVDLIQGNFTSMPTSDPLHSIPDHIASLISKLSANAGNQVLQKTYMTAGEMTLYLHQLDLEHYTDIFIAQPEIEIIGSFGEASGLHIRTKDELDCTVILRNIHFNGPVQAPAIQIGRNSRVTLVFQGDNRMDVGGIFVPESSELHLTGKGNLSIRTDDVKSFAIGCDADYCCGSITVDLAGCLNIISNGNQCIGIGAGIGKGQRIDIIGTRLFIEMSGKEGVAVGTLSEGAKVTLSGCEGTFGLRIAQSTAVGALEGAPDILCNTASLSVTGSGNAVCCIGSHAGGGMMTLRDTSLNAELTGQNIMAVGSGNGTPKLTLRQCDMRIKAEGTRVMDFGSFDGISELMILDSDLDISISSAKALHFAAKKDRCIVSGGKKKVAINQ